MNFFVGGGGFIWFFAGVVERTVQAEGEKEKDGWEVG